MAKQLNRLGQVSIGDKFIFRSEEIIGSGHFKNRPPFEGQVLIVVGFKPRYVNNVVVQQPDGTQSLIPLNMVEKARSLKSLRVDSE